MFAASGQKFIDVGGGPDKLPPKYHTVIDLPSVQSKKGSSSSSSSSNSGKEQHKQPAWKSIFNTASNNNGNSNKKLNNGQDKLALPPELEEQVKKAKVNIVKLFI